MTRPVVFSLMLSYIEMHHVFPSVFDNRILYNWHCCFAMCVNRFEKIVVYINCGCLAKSNTKWMTYSMFESMLCVFMFSAMLKTHWLWIRIISTCMALGQSHCVFSNSTQFDGLSNRMTRARRMAATIGVSHGSTTIFTWNLFYTCALWRISTVPLT